ncbi:MAG: hypothetical protein DKM50_03805 [Candidatus Margulisiibacteriota bacterium]|nr:MAG: hypothetical protein A2X43_01520 [Candidatus Margulisbacteria bacterium GWD2_39_127]OGI07111.1 MAG: hypothetical protein A2X41_12755 [Candidatus Margulisbacteria bacterium GWE2_39_32]PZM82261.1 MAG: hypothetical protein DKM50_03805 [Candidatus Margulisiibacteriota bacterium]
MPAIHSSDMYIYISWIQQIKEGAIFLHNTFTQEHGYPFLNPFFLLGGILIKFLNLPNIIGYHFLRISAITASLMIFFLFIKTYLTTTRERIIALCLIGFSGGLWAPGEWLTEHSIFLEFYENALHTFALGVITLFSYIYVKKPKYYLYYLTILANILILSHSYDVVIIFGIVLTHLLADTIVHRKLNLGLVRDNMFLLLFSLPSVLYMGYLVTHDLILKQGVTLSSKAYIFPVYFAVYGVLAILAAIGVYIARSQLKNRYLFVASWLLTYPLIIYIPIPFALSFAFRLVLGWQIPMAIFAALAVETIYQKATTTKSSKKGVLVIATILILSSGNNLAFLFQDIWDANRNRTTPYYIPADYMRAFQWIDKNTKNKEIFFGDFYTCYFLTALAGNRVYWGNIYQTYKLKEKEKAAQPFFSTTPNAGKSFLHSNNLSYVIIGPWENTHFKGSINELGKIVKKSGDVTIIKVPVMRSFED